MLIELTGPIHKDRYPQTDFGEDGYPTIDWLMERIWSYGPPEIHDKEFYDPDKVKYYH
jgi:hypothetical protein